MKTLGEINYHRFKISLKASEDEKSFTVDKQEDNVNQTETFTDFSRAKTKFDYLVTDALYYSSFTDVSIWMQHHD
jgi:hypothetical protein